MRSINPIVLVGLALLFLPGCLTINMRREFDCLEKLAHERTGEHLILKSYEQIVDEKDILEDETMLHGLTRQEAVRIALQNNEDLQADLQRLGIAKAELVQAGLLTNPDFFHSSLKPLGRVSDDVLDLIDSSGPADLSELVLFYMDDFWKKPFAVKVARDELEIIFTEIEQKIIQVKKDTEQAYNFCLFAVEKLAAAESFVIMIKEFYEIIKQRMSEEKESDEKAEKDVAKNTDSGDKAQAKVDKDKSSQEKAEARVSKIKDSDNEAQTKTDEAQAKADKDKKDADEKDRGHDELILWSAEIILGGEMLRTEEAKAEVRAGFARLRALMAMRVTSERIPLLDSLYTVMRPLPIVNDLVMQALDSHPEARNAFYKVERARHTISSERANVIPGDVQLGFATDVLGDVKSLGPALNIGVPLFDTNQAQIARAHFLFDQAEKELLKAHTKVTRDVLESYYKLEGFVAQVETYIGPIKPAFERAIEYIMTHKEDEAKMPFSDLLNVLQELDGFFDVKIRYFETLRKTLDEYADLEFAAGRDVPFTVLTAPNNTTPTHSSPEAHMFHLFELALSALSAASAQ